MGPERMYAFADHYAKLGLVSVSVQYRLASTKTNTTVFDCVKDVRSAVRHVKDSRRRARHRSRQSHRQRRFRRRPSRRLDGDV
jgi:acetyl esterase/lipase